MTMQVHDELVFDVPKGEVEAMKAIIVNRMKNAMPVAVPIEVEIGQGNNWLEAH
jgi:DNA polymerase-1